MTWIKTYDGNKFDYLNPDLESVSLIDISHSLSKEQRFGSHLEKSWTVGQHVMLVRKLVLLAGGSKEQSFIALHHDDAEAFMKDMPTPLKQLLPDYHKIYERVENAISKKFQVQINPLDKFVKENDSLAVRIEDLLFFSKNSEEIKWHNLTIEDYKKYCEKTNGELDRYISYLFSLSFDEIAKLYREYHYNYKNKDNDYGFKS